MATLRTLIPKPLGGFHFFGGTGHNALFDSLKPTASRLLGGGSLASQIFIEIFNFLSHNLSCQTNIAKLVLSRIIDTGIGALETFGLFHRRG